MNFNIKTTKVNDILVPKKVLNLIIHFNISDVGEKLTGLQLFCKSDINGLEITDPEALLFCLLRLEYHIVCEFSDAIEILKEIILQIYDFNPDCDMSNKWFIKAE